jgi:two-component system, OmpR family, sensor histidine kinase BaeS
MNSTALATRVSGKPAWHRWLDTLRVKLFLAIAGANVVLVAAAYLIYSWSFDQGLVEYLNRADEARLQPLVVQLAEGYGQQGDWRWVSEDHERWQALVRNVLGVGRWPRRGPEPGAAAAAADGAVASSAPAAAASMPDRGAMAPRQAPPLTIDPRLMLFDAGRRVLVGPPERAAQAVLKPIEHQGRLVGHLGYVPRLQVVASLEAVFVQQQSRKFAAIALGLLAAVLLNAALIAHWLSRRLKPLHEGAEALARGDYSQRITVHGQDELARLAVDFNELADALTAARRLRQQWIADIAHELRTPLATLRAEIEALQDGVRPLSQAGVSSLAQEVGQLTRLVEDLRLLSLSDLGALTYRKEKLDLGELIDDSLATSRSAMRDQRLQLQLQLEPGLFVQADAERLAQVFGNLLQNTLRYSEAPARLEVTLVRQGANAMLVWQDSSPGVPEADLLRLTERLFRVDASRARASGGSGLGLAIVKAIVEAHGGGLQAAASALGGLRWEITLPLAASAPGAAHG